MAFCILEPKLRREKWFILLSSIGNTYGYTVDYRQLRAFIAVFEERNITSAARCIHLSQPALSGSIKQLEETLGTTLFVRMARGVDVTEEARALYPLARQMVADADLLVRRFKDRRNRALLQIGVEADVSREVLGRFVKAVTQAVPCALLRLLSGCQGDARLASEELRCEDELFLPLHSESYVLALPKDQALAPSQGEPGVVPDKVPWITYPDHPSHQRLQPLYGVAGTAPAAQADSFGLALALVAAGAGAAVVPESLVGEHGGVVGQPIANLDLKRRTGLCYSVQSMSNPTLTWVRDALQTRASREPMMA